MRPIRNAEEQRTKEYYYKWIKDSGGTFHRSSELKQVDAALHRFLACKTAQHRTQLYEAFRNWQRAHPNSKRNGQAIQDLDLLIENAFADSSVSREVEQVAVGSDLYLFRTIRHSFDTANPRLLISSHGGGCFGAKRFVPDCNINFYVHNGLSLEDTGIKAFINNMRAPVERVTGGNSCLDYELEKYQTGYDPRDSDLGESYQSIVNDLTMLRNYQQQLALGANPAQTHNSVVFLNPRIPYDVCTIRRHGGMTLSKLLRTLRENHHYYDEIYCAFCRVYWKDTMPWSGESAGDAAPYSPEYQAYEENLRNTYRRRRF